jgi:predicted nucleic acid-binding protein
VAGGEWAISTQMLQEFLVVVTRRLAEPLTPLEALGAVDELAASDVVTIDADIIRSAAATSLQHRISLWDALVVEAARRGGRSVVLTEDLS